jgi:hypothetical protein
MRRVFSLAFALLTVMLCAAMSQSATVPATMIGVGAHGYDFIVGTWSCTNSMPPSPVGGPATSSWTIGRSAVPGAFSFHLTGKNFDGAGYIFYDAKTKTWWTTAAYPNGDYSAESSKGTGQKVVFVGPYFAAADKFATSQIRDSLTFIGLTKLTDVGASETGGTWKTTYNNTCVKP